MSTPNPFLAAEDWNDTVREAEHDSGTPRGGPNPFLTGRNPATGEPGYGIALASPGAWKAVTAHA